MCWKGMSGPMGCAIDERPMVIELTNAFNKIGEMNGYIYSSEDGEIPECMSKLSETIVSVREYLKQTQLLKK